jgi:DNA-binding winged helix-turn-helix (wHTH) protein
MKLGSHILFPPFQLDLANAQLWRGEQRVVLRPKTFAVLSNLVENAGRQGSKNELLGAVWPDTRVRNCKLTSDRMTNIRSGRAGSIACDEEPP